MRPRCSSLIRVLFSVKPLHSVFLSSPVKLRFHSTIHESTTAEISHPRDNVMNRYFDKPFHRLESLFGSREMLIKAFAKNPCILKYDFDKTITPVAEMYDQLGIGNSDLVSLLLTLPTLITRSKLCEEKLEYIRKTGVSRESKMYKHVVSIMAISRIETIREKLAHFQKYGFTEDEVLRAIGRSPYLLTLSIDKVQRNMTFLMAVIKLPAKVALCRPFLLYTSLDIKLKPRMHLASKIDEMDLVPRINGHSILTALEMEDNRFIKRFIYHATLRRLARS